MGSEEYLDSDLKAYLRGVAYELWQFADSGETKVDAFSSDSGLSWVLRSNRQFVERRTPSNSARLINEFANNFEPWTKNTSTLPEIVPTKTSIYKEIYDEVSKIIDFGARQPYQIEEYYDSIFEWYEKYKKGSSHAATP